MSDDYEDAVRLEREAVERLDAALEVIRADLRWYWHWGDGAGGYLFERIKEIVQGEGYQTAEQIDARVKAKAKDRISQSLRTRVFERDEYRCVVCKTHIDLSCDHIIPESEGGPTTFENLQTMCRPCNSRKGTKMPEGEG